VNLYEHEAVECMPVAAFVGGEFQEHQEGVAFGHAGAVAGRGMGKASTKKRLLAAAGPNVRVARYYHNLLDCVRDLGVVTDLPDAGAAEVAPRYATI
jgi:succinyl-CoA synthetase alpha subunit